MFVLVQFLPNPTEQQMIRELLDAGEVIVVDEEFIIEEEGVYIYSLYSQIWINLLQSPDNLGQTGTPGNWKKRCKNIQ